MTALIAIKEIKLITIKVIMKTIIRIMVRVRIILVLTRLLMT